VREKLIVALDVKSFDEAKRIVDILYPHVKIFKVGSKLFTSCGPEIIKAIHKKGGEVFLDLKFHDIPNTVSGSVESAAQLGVFMLTVHTLGGSLMLKEAAESAMRSARKFNTRKVKIVGVTVLTSMDNKDLRGVGISRDLKKEVISLAKLAKKQGLDGIVASAAEAKHIRKVTGKNFIIITPGIRPSGAAKDDQKRIVTPKDAIRNGASYIVVGRPIIEAKNPRAATIGILKEIEDAKKK